MLLMAKLRLPMKAWDLERPGKGPPLAAHVASSQLLAEHWLAAGVGVRTAREVSGKRRDAGQARPRRPEAMHAVAAG